MLHSFGAGTSHQAHTASSECSKSRRNVDGLGQSSRWTMGSFYPVPDLEAEIVRETPNPDP